MNNSLGFKEVQDILKSRPEHYISLLFSGINHRKNGSRIYFDEPNFDSWDYNLVTNICVDFRNGKSYDLISLYAHFFTSNDQGKALNEIKSRIEGVCNDKLIPINKPCHTKSVKNEQNLEEALVIWKHSQPATGTMVETYLENRGIFLDGTIPPTIRFHSSLPNHESRKRYGSMVCAITKYPSNKIIGLQYTLLENGQKAPVKLAKIFTNGGISGGAVRLTKLSNPLIIGEGLETVLSAHMATGLAAWSALTTSGLRSVQVPPPNIIKEIYIFADNDEAGRDAAHFKASMLKDIGHIVRICFPGDCKDFNDLIRR